MPRKKKRGRKKRKANAGSFKPGFDPRRHVFTRAERALGYAHCMLGHGRCSDPRIAAWVYRRVRGYYRAKEVSDGEEKDCQSGTSGNGTGGDAGDDDIPL